MKLAFNSLISSTGTFASLLKDTFFVDNLLKNRAKPIRLACHMWRSRWFRLQHPLFEWRPQHCIHAFKEGSSLRNYWQILYLLWVSASLSRVFEYSIKNSSSVRPRLGHSSPNQLCPWLVVVSHDRLTQTKDHKNEHWTVFGFGEEDKPGMTRRRPQSSPTTVTLPANDNIARKNLIRFFFSLNIVISKFRRNILKYQ